MLNAVIVRRETPETPTVPVHFDLRHTECTEGLPVEDRVAGICQPNRDAFKTQAGYDRALERAYRCTACGLPVS